MAHAGSDHDDNTGFQYRMMVAKEALERCPVDFNVLIVVTAQTAKSIRDIYSFFASQNLLYQQYIPCLDTSGSRGVSVFSDTRCRVSPRFANKTAQGALRRSFVESNNDPV